MTSFSSRFSKLLDNKEKTQAYIAQGLGLTRQTYIYNILKGKHTPTIENVNKIADLLECSKKERKELLLLAASERTPEDVKRYFNPRSTLNPAWKAASIDRVFWPIANTNISPLLNEEFFDSNTVLLESSFMEPIFLKGQKILIAEYRIDSLKDEKCFELGNYVVVNYGEDGSSESKFCWGKLTKKEKTTWSIQDPKSDETFNIPLTNIDKIGKIIGLLF
ncbi:MAG: helix-turn-helix transcriptional regulator [Candidatus Omnitrophota bacterium]